MRVAMSDVKPTPTEGADAENHLIAERKAKLERLRAKGNAFPNDFRRNAAADDLQTAYGAHAGDWLDFFAFVS